MQMELPAGFERVTWLGPGPQETYADRKDARFGLLLGNGGRTVLPPTTANRAKPATRRMCAGFA